MRKTFSSKIYWVLLFVILLQLFDFFWLRSGNYSILNNQTLWGYFESSSLILFLDFVVAVLGLFFFRNAPSFSFVLIISGAFSNLIERLFHGGVVDYFSLYSFPVFNLTDVFLTIGFLILLIDVCVNFRTKSKLSV